MPSIVKSSACECHPYAVRVASALDDLARKVRAEWLAHVIGVPASMVCEWRKGTRNIPLFRAAQIDEAMGSHALLTELAAMEGCGVHALDPVPMSLSSLAHLIPQIIREEGSTNADVFEALSDGVLDDSERSQLYAHFCKLEIFFRDAKERAAPTNEKATERVAS